MIGFLRGNIINATDKFILLDVSGVGYKVYLNIKEINLSHYTDIDGAAKKQLSLYIHTVVREDALELFGFLEEMSLNLFVKLISISGIGPRSGLGILAAGSVESLSEAIQKGDLGYLTAVSGIGKKTAEKIILELRGALHDIMGGINENEEVLMALKSLGYSERDVQGIIKEIKEGSVEERIKKALKYLGK